MEERQLHLFVSDVNNHEQQRCVIPNKQSDTMNMTQILQVLSMCLTQKYISTSGGVNAHVHVPEGMVGAACLATAVPHTDWYHDTTTATAHSSIPPLPHSRQST